VPAFSHETHGKANVFNRFADRHPYRGVLLLFVMLLVVSQGMTPLFGLVIASLFPGHRVPLSFLQNVALGEIPLVLLVVGLISVLGWWADTGFTRWSSRQGVVVCLVPFALTGLKILYAPFGSLNAPLSTAITAVAFALAVGFVEEGLFRGLLFRTLLPKGIVLSAIVSSVLFACFHLINLFSGVPWSYVASQLLFTLGLGSLFAAVVSAAYPWCHHRSSESNHPAQRKRQEEQARSLREITPRSSSLTKKGHGS
jgi:membrane protease YdiL (CAAX protease family)